MQTASQMPRTYVRKNLRKQWSQESMSAAVTAVCNKEMGYLKASKFYGVPQTTLERMTKRSGIGIKEAISVPLGRKPTLPQDVEADLADYIMKMEERLFGLTTIDVRRLAFQLAIRNNVKNHFNVEAQMAGKDWLALFLARQPMLSLRSPESTSAARASAFNKINVGKFFDLLEKEMDCHGFPPSRIFNVDEKGITTVQSHNAKVIALKGKKQVGVLSSAERGRIVTTVICMSASGDFIPPMFIFPRQRMKMELMDGAPPGSVYACHKTGWIQLDLFTEWFQHFINKIKPSEKDPALLILDGHASHVKNLDVIDLARKHHVTIICLPPHCTHRMQPLDVSFMKPLTTYYDSEIQTWLRSHPGRVVTEFQLTSIFGKAYLRAASLATAVNGFAQTGIWPVNRNVFEEHEFMPAAATEIPAPRPMPAQELQQDVRIEACEPGTSERVDFVDEIPVVGLTNDIMPMNTQNLTPSCSHYIEHHQKATPEDFRAVMPDSLNSDSTVKRCRAVDISPYPVTQMQERTKKSANRKGYTAVVTSTPYKESLLQQSAVGLSHATSRKNNGKGSKNRKKLFPDNPPKAKEQKERKANRKSKKQDDDAPCIYCLGLFSEDEQGEKWIMCMDCKKWAHCECCGVEKDEQPAS